jgi:predicted HicB family RNase H-like nuclease
MINDEVLSLRLTKEDKHRLTELAKEQRISVSAFVRQKTLAPKPKAYVLKDD